MSTTQIFIWILFCIISLINSVLDIKTMHISLWTNYIGFFLTIIITIHVKHLSVYENVVSTITLGLVFMLVRLLTKNGLGLGDVYYSLYCGFLSSILPSILSIFIASCLAILWFIVYKIVFTKRRIRFLRIPFIPFMFLGTILGNFVFSSF